MTREAGFLNLTIKVPGLLKTSNFVKDLILLNAENKQYGVSNASLGSEFSLEIWELLNAENYLPLHRVKQL